MGLPGAEIPPQRRDAEVGGTEGLPKDAKENRGLYTLVFGILGGALLLLIVGWIWLAVADKSVPEAMPVVIGSIVGAMVGVVAAGKSE